MYSPELTKEEDNNSTPHSFNNHLECNDDKSVSNVSGQNKMKVLEIQTSELSKAEQIFTC